MVKAIFFDLDGVLVDCTHWHFVALNTALKEVIGYEIPYDDHITNYNGLPTPIKLKRLRDNGIAITDDQFNDITKLKKQYTNKIIDEQSKMDFVKISMLRQLEQKYILACVTNSNRVSTEKMLKLAGMLEYFNFIVCNEDVQNNKPAPDCYLRAIKTAQKLIPDLDPLEVLIFEDSPKGVEAAKACGANVITVSNIDYLNTYVVSTILGELGMNK